MSIPSRITGSNGLEARVSDFGELVVGTVRFSSPHQASVNGTTITNVVTPKTHEFFVITDIIVAQDRTNTDSAVTIYEADSVGGTSVVPILNIDVAKSQVVALTGLRLITKKNNWINFTSDSGTSTITVTIMGYYISQLSRNDDIN